MGEKIESEGRAEPVGAGRVALVGPSLTSRETAVSDRVVLVEQILRWRRVSLDISGVRDMSRAYADELFGVLVGRRGPGWFSDRVELVGGDGDVVRRIDTVVGSVEDRAVRGAGHDPA